MPNRLANESSPYLLQHADNPVDWYPWGEEAFERAQKENKPVLLSIGYSACHWCHVMAHESFQNKAIAALMNANFINIKVDREERPDLDHIYMEAVQAMGIGGGWPLTVFLTPDKKPFSGGTYFPPEDRYNMPGFPKVLQTIARVYQSKPENIGQITTQLAKAMQSRSLNGKSTILAELLKSAWENLLPVFDGENGGFGDRPKFPQPLTLEFLLRYYAASKESSALQMVEFTLEKMAAGGIYDQIGGGFHRYSTDDIWLVPHFEKMLYDNALLSRVYLHAYLAGGNQSFAQIARETLDYVFREMLSPEGGFYSTQDADSEGVEGRYFVWTAEEIEGALGPELASLAKVHFGITQEGNFESSNILHAAGRDIDPQKLGEIKRLLLAARGKRIKPGRDEKILTSWNGMLLQSLAEAALVLRRADYLEAAVANAEFIRKNLVKDGWLMHVYKDGTAKVEGFLEDYAQLIQGLLVLHQATLNPEWLKWAIELSENMVARFTDSKGVLFDTGENSADLIIRPRNIYDGVVPSGPAGAVQVLLTMAVVTGREQFKTIAETNLKSIASDLAANPLGFSQWLCSADFFLAAPLELVLACKRKDVPARNMAEAIAAKWLPNKIVVAFDPQKKGIAGELPIFKEKDRINNKPTLFICWNYTCRSPLTGLQELEKELSLL